MGLQLFASSKCENCDEKPKRSGYKYCSKSCAEGAEAKMRSRANAKFRAASGAGQTGATTNNDQGTNLCEECHFKPKQTSNVYLTGTATIHRFCSQKCKANNKQRQKEAASQEQATRKSRSASEGNSFSKTYHCCGSTITTVRSPPPESCPLCVQSSPSCPLCTPNNSQASIGSAAGRNRARQEHAPLVTVPSTMAATAPAPIRNSSIPERNLRVASRPLPTPPPTPWITSQFRSGLNSFESVQANLAGQSFGSGVPTNGLPTPSYQNTSFWVKQDIHVHQQYYEQDQYSTHSNAEIDDERH